MKTLLFKSLFCFLLIPALVLSCTTSDEGGDESVEGELNSELDDIDDVADGSVADGATEDSEFEDFEDDTSGGKEGGDGSSGEDEEFFAEDADKPTDNQDMAEKDLQKELDKSGDVGEGQAATTAPSVDEMEPAATSNAPPSDVSTSTGGVASGAITSKETPITSTGFEPVAPPTLQLPKDDLGISDPLVADVDPPLPAEKAAKEVVPVSKIGKDPYFKNQRLMNTVYIARQGDDPGSISEKLFGKDNISVLMADNARLSEGVSVGDKVYYNSPNRPEDKKEILTYYEDKKIPAQYYTTKEGDNIQKIGRELLGHDDAWKEVWATNDLQTQALLPAGLKLRYWSGGESMVPPIEPPIMASTDSGSSGSAATTPSPPTEPPSDNLPDLSEVGQTEDPSAMQPEETPMPTEIATSAPSAAPAVTKESSDSLLMIAGIALVSLAILVLIAIQIKNRKHDDGTIPPSMEFTKI